MYPLRPHACIVYFHMHVLFISKKTPRVWVALIKWISEERWLNFIFGPAWFYVIHHSVVIRRFIKYSVFVYRLFINSFIAENTPFDDNLLPSLSLFLLFGAREKESLFLTPGAQEEDSKGARLAWLPILEETWQLNAVKIILPLERFVFFAVHVTLSTPKESRV